MSADIPTTVLQHLINNELFCRKISPHLKAEYFETNEQKLVFDIIDEFVKKYNKPPTADAIKIILTSDRATDKNASAALKFTSTVLNSTTVVDFDFLVDQTEAWCKERSVFNAVMESIAIIDGQREGTSPNAIPALMEKALSVSFDTSIGHDYIESAEDRYNFYHEDIQRIPFDIDMLNKITRGGVVKKSLNCLIAGCVHPDTKIRIRTVLSERTISIGKIRAMLKEGNMIEVHSPDGWVHIDGFVDKGTFDEYVLYVDGSDRIRCNEGHLFETDKGWIKAGDMLEGSTYSVLHKDGTYHESYCVRTGNRIPIVDISVNHENHRYYTENISSHNTGVGKSICLCHFAASYLSQGLNTLYITLEMSENRIAERIDANLLDITIDKLASLEKEDFLSKVKGIGAKTRGKLIIKEYPTSSMHTGHLRALLNDLQLKKSFIPDIIIVDYLNIMSSVRVKSSGATETYTYVKAMAEELRGLAQECNVPIWTATQANRDGNNNSDIELNNTSDSFGIPMSLDLFIALMTNEQLEEMGQIMVKQLKNRYNDLNYYKRFVIGMHKSKMKLYDVDITAQQSLLNTQQNKGGGAPVPASPFAIGKASRNATVKKFTGFKV